MTHLNPKKIVTDLDSKIVYGNTKPNKTKLAFPALLIASILMTGSVAAEQSTDQLSEEALFVTEEQQQELINWSLEAQAGLSKRLDIKLHQELTRVLHASGQFLDAQPPEINFPPQKILCEEKSALASSAANISLGACYVALPK